MGHRRKRRTVGFSSWVLVSSGLVLASVRQDGGREGERERVSERESAAEGGREIEKERERARVLFFVYVTVDIGSVWRLKVAQTRER